jgi:hypothetical protein
MMQAQKDVEFDAEERSGNDYIGPAITERLRTEGTYRLQSIHTISPY